MMPSRGKYEAAFETGELQELSRMKASQAHRLKVLHLAILANALSGEWAAALALYNWALTQRVRFTSQEEAIVHFALGVGHTRISEYARAREFFARNARLRHAGPLERFFIHQGFGFYRYFSGHFSRSAKWARQAYEGAIQENFAFGALISEELLAHALTESGEVRLGMKHMRQAWRRARQMNHQSLGQSIQLFLLLNEARFGLDWSCVSRLERALRKLHPTDTYSRNAVKLELANQWTLRGETARAFEVLDEACDSVYASQNRRQIAQLNFRLAFLTWLRGRREESLHLLKSAELHLHREVDAQLWTRMQGLRDRIVDAETWGGRRARGAEKFGEDRIADLYRQVNARDPEGLRTVLAHGLFFFLYGYFGLRFDQQAILLDLLPRGAVIIDQGNIRVIDKGLSRINRRILEFLAQSHQSKQELIENVWGYAYEARHDALVHNSISKIRALLGRSGEWIESDEKGYRLRSGVRLSGHEPSLTWGAPKIRRTIIQKITNSSLNFRQLRILSGFDNSERDWLGVDEVMRDFDISRATATRDLSELARQGYLRRLGRARATRYVRGET